MNKFKKSLALLLCMATVLSMTACGDAGAGETSTTETTIDDDIENSVDVGDISVDPGVKGEIEPVELQYVGCYDLTKAGDVKPAYKYFQENYNCSIKVQIVGSMDIEETVSKLIVSDSAPDLVDKQDNTYPHWVSKNYYTALDDYMDLSAPQWAGLEKYINKYTWNGEHYYYPWSYDVSPFFLIYNRGIFEQEGIKDPKELYDEGNWNWNTFKDCMVQFMNNDSERTGLYGAIQTSFVDTTGTAFIEMGADGKLINNMRNASVERAQLFLEDLRKQGISKFFGDYIDVNEEPIIDGKTAFQSMGGWIITNYARKMANNDSLDIFFVPYPQDPNADDYYLNMSTFGYLVPKGSKNIKQACVFINCARLSVTDESLATTTKESIMKNKKYTEEMYTFLQEFKKVDNFSCIIDEPFGFDTDTVTIVKDLLNKVAFDHTEEQQTWTQMRETNYSIIQDKIDYYNAFITT